MMYKYCHLLQNLTYYPLSNSPGQVKLPVEQVDLSNAFFDINIYKQIKNTYFSKSGK